MAQSTKEQANEQHYLYFDVFQREIYCYKCQLSLAGALDAETDPAALRQLESFQTSLKFTMDKIFKERSIQIKDFPEFKKLLKIQEEKQQER